MPYEYECYQKTQLIKKMLLLEGHLADFQCQHCIRKHKLEIEALAEETIAITPNKAEQAVFKKVIRLVKGKTDLNELRKTRKYIMALTPRTCGGRRIVTVPKGFAKRTGCYGIHCK